MFCGTFAGVMIVGNIKPIGLSYGIGAAMATLSISIFAVGNALGRLSWGAISDKIGYKAIPFSLLISAIAVIALIPAEKNATAFVVAALVVAFAYGANFVLYAAEVASRYRSRFRRQRLFHRPSIVTWFGGNNRPRNRGLAIRHD